MKEMMSCKEAAWRWEISQRRVTRLCKEGRIEGAKKAGGRWVIPSHTRKPQDRRVKDAMFVREQELHYEGRRPLPIGISDFKRACTRYYYVDKTLLIRDFLDEQASISLFTRPRRFGKTLNMDMLRVFFEKTEEDTWIYFKDKEIWKCGPHYRAHYGKYPVIFLSFKDVRYGTWEEAQEYIKLLFQQEYGRHRELLNSDRCEGEDRAYFQKVLECRAEGAELAQALIRLSVMLDAHYDIPPVLLIDEYDTPIQQGHMRGYYDEVILFMGNLLSAVLKDNRHLSFGFLTGILRVAKESIFSGLNNLRINSVLDDRYSRYFGFTAEEVREMCRCYNAEDKYDEICDWYDGYRFGRTEIFNPWSVINYLNNDCNPQPYWVSTSSNDAVKEILAAATPKIREDLAGLMQGKTVLTSLELDVIYPKLGENPDSIYSFLLVCGYLKAARKEQLFTGDYMCEVALPNREVASVYAKEILAFSGELMPRTAFMNLQKALYTGDSDALQGELEQILLRTVSYYDAASEGFYHGLLLGLCAAMENYYTITSNREAGMGRYDIQLMPKKAGRPGILIELKTAKNCTEKQLAELASAALEQIDNRRYDEELRRRGAERILKFGAAFCGKQVCVVSKAETVDE